MFLFVLQTGFTITEVQKKQAMLNASKSHPTGKPKGEFQLFYYVWLYALEPCFQDTVWNHFSLSCSEWVVPCVVTVHLFTSTCLIMFVCCFIITALPWNSISFTAPCGTQISITSSPKNFQVPTFFRTFRTSGSQGHLNFTSPPWRPSA